MMNLKMYQIDAFSDKIFGGNPASIIPLQEWLNEDLMQNIAMENNLSETAFFVKEGENYHIRWFTPTTEVKLCGHATLASAYVIFNYIKPNLKEIAFNSKSGELKVLRDGEFLTMDFPMQIPIKTENLNIFQEAFGVAPIKVLKGNDYLVIFENEEIIKSIKPNFEKLKKLDLRGVIVSAKGDKIDFVSRFFAPNFGIDEDPVTGSAHTILTPYWAKELKKEKLFAKQLSKRGGELICEISNNRVKISGKAVEFMQATINI